MTAGHCHPRATVRLKLLTMGETETGKSCLVRRYRWEHHHRHPDLHVQHMEDEHTGDYEPTLGVDFLDLLKVRDRMQDGQEARVVTSCFDMSGDIQFLKVRSEFYQDFHGIILVFDITSRASFERLELWLGEASKFGSSILQSIHITHPRITRSQNY
jgi:GTPase SAR1 family protein